MSLWLRMILALLLAATPASFVLLLVMRDIEWDARVDGLVNLAHRLMENGGRSNCETQPESFGGPMLGMLRAAERQLSPRIRQRARRELPEITRRSRMEIWAYDAEFLSRNDRAPVLALELVEELESGADVASRVVPQEESPRPIFEVALRMDWWPDGPCAALLIRDVRLPSMRPMRYAGLGILVVILSAALGIALAAWPVVRRLRRLTEEVKDSAKEFDLQVDVQGRDEVKLLETAFEQVHGRIREQVTGLRRREDALRAFVRNTMHDVMIPLSVLQGHLSAARQLGSLDESQRRDLWTGAVQEAEYVRSILENLNTFAKLEADALPMRDEEFSLGELVERVATRLRVLARSRDVELDYGLPQKDLRLRGDPVLLEQALGNLVHNAVQYSDRGGLVELWLESEGEDYILRVLDEGPGLSDAELARVLEPRFRGEEGRTRNPSGSGLGLHISREIVERHGAHLSLARRSERGLVAEIRGSLR
jgi:signal transduction histidine kinase